MHNGAETILTKTLGGVLEPEKGLLKLVSVDEGDEEDCRLTSRVGACDTVLFELGERSWFKSSFF